jgi:hypothetical protein
VLDGARRGTEKIAHRDELTWLARSGLLARGVVYGIIGVLAFKLAIGSGGATTNQQGAFQEIAHQPFGEVLLIAVAIGLAAYAAWRLVRAAVGHGGQETDSAFDRVAAAGSGLVYLALCFTAVKVLTGASRGSGSGAPKKETSGVLGWSGGPVLVAIAGAVLIGIGLYQGYKGLAGKFVDEANTARMSRATERTYTALGVFGHLARMVVFALTGYGLLSAAIEFDPKKAKGLDGALAELARDPHGSVLLGVVAAGLVGFALYSIADARYRRV